MTVKQFYDRRKFALRIAQTFSILLCIPLTFMLFTTFMEDGHNTTLQWVGAFLWFACGSVLTCGAIYYTPKWVVLAIFHMNFIFKSTTQYGYRRGDILTDELEAYELQMEAEEQLLLKEAEE